MLFQQNTPNTPQNAPDDAGNRQGGGGAVDAGRNRTGANARSVMSAEGGSEQQLLTADKVLSNVQETTNEMHSLHELMAEASSEARSILAEDKNMLDAWNGNERMLAIETPKMRKAEHAAQAVSSFAGGGMSPHDLIHSLQEEIFHDGAGHVALRDLRSEIGQVIGAELRRIGAEQGGRLTWESSNATTKMAIAQAVIASPLMQFYLLQLNTLASGWKKSLEDSKTRKFTEEIRSEIIQLAKSGQMQGYGDGLYGSLKRITGLEFYTIGQMVGGFKKAWEAITTAWERRQAIGEAKFARGLGAVAKMLPWVGDEVDDVLKDNVERKDEEEEELHYKYLDRHNTGYPDLQIWIRANMHNHNRIRAGIRYAAANGWLYDLDVNRRTALGLNLEDFKSSNIKIEDYIEKLQRDNNKGVNDAIDIGRNKAGIRENIELIVRDIEQEFKDYHFFRIVGMVDVAIKQKGKSGEVSSWVATTILSLMRQFPESAKLLPEYFFDKVGGPGLGHPGFTSQFLKFGRRDLVKWANGIQNDFSKAGMLAGVVKSIEDDIIARSGTQYTTEKELQKLNAMTAQVLSGYTVAFGNGQAVSIFDSRYDSYRQSLLVPPGGYDYKADPGPADPDFFGMRSEVILINQTSNDTFLTISSAGDFEYADKAVNYLGRILEAHDEFNKRRQEATGSQRMEAERSYRNYQREMGQKMQNWFQSACRHRSGERVAFVDALIADESGKSRPEPALAGMVKRGLINIEALDSEARNSALCKNILRQLGREAPPQRRAA